MLAVADAVLPQALDGAAKVAGRHEFRQARTGAGVAHHKGEANHGISLLLILDVLLYNAAAGSYRA